MSKNNNKEIEDADKFLKMMDKIGNARWLAPAIVLVIGIIAALIIEGLTS